ncbi:extracellular solute-binding protein [Pseudonocardia sp. DSM 110487]|uniref:ABC transporter substrate-binding protein n=1 Tax=Pseudonocardia sp. DSM 110487 TaxID=2865833 RepID=UPI001C6A527E|nr:extracellular solute-binding protein [Pseudonocardia sp. DSM 110487]QYN37875.1 extracellular solute-binding protein [Pseudonocardia sp. DSM 110487]
MGANRRTVVLAVGAVFSLLALAACGGGGGQGGGSGGGGQLDVLVGANSNYPEQQQEWFTHIQDAFRARTGAEVRFETFASAADEQKRIQTAVVSGEGPDVYSLGTTFTPVAQATRAFVELGDAEWAAIGGRERFTPATLAMSGPDATHQVGIPFLSRPFAMAYNTELFAQAGLSGPPTTWDQFVEYGKQLTKDGVYGAAIAYSDDYDPWKFIWMFANQYGNKLVDGDRVRLDDPTVQRAYQEYFGFLTEDRIVSPEAVGWKNPQALASFAEGKAAMMLMTTPTSIPTLEKSAVAGKFAYAPMPAVPPGESALAPGGVPATTIVSGDNIAIADYSDNKDLALQFVELVTSEEEQLHYTEVFGDLPTNAAAAQKVTSSNAQLAPILQAGATAVPTPFTGAWSEVQLALTNVTVQSRAELAAGGVPPEVIAARLAEAQGTSQAALDRAGQ